MKDESTFCKEIYASYKTVRVMIIIIVIKELEPSQWIYKFIIFLILNRIIEIDCLLQCHSNKQGHVRHCQWRD